MTYLYGRSVACALLKNSNEKNGALRSKWSVDHETPMFSKDREYVEQFVYLNRGAAA